MLSPSAGGEATGLRSLCDDCSGVWKAQEEEDMEEEEDAVDDNESDD